MAYVGADGRRTGQSDLGVHVGAVHVYLAARGVHDVADIAHAVLEHAVRGGIGDHQGVQPAGMLRRPGPQIVHVDVAAVVAGHDDHPHARHGRARRVGAVCRGGDQHDVAIVLAARPPPGADHHQAGQLALGPGVRLQRHGVQAGDGAQRRFELGEHGVVAGRLVRRRERVHCRELGPRDGAHLGRRVQLHRARSEWNHRPVQTDVLLLQLAQVAHHLRLGPVAAEHGMCQERARALERRRPVGRCRGA